MTEPTFEDVRHKPLDLLSQDEQQLIVENKDKLDDEERDAFSSLLTPATTGVDDGDAGGDKEGGEKDTGKEDEGEQDASGEGKNGEGNPASAVVTFKTPEEIQAYVDKRIEEKTKEIPPMPPVETKKEDAKHPEPPKPIFPEGYEPKDWNEFAAKLQEHLVPKTVDTLKEMTKAEQDEMRRINSGFTQEFSELVSEGKLPDPEKEPDKFQAAEKQILAIGVTYGQESIKTAYDLWSKIPTDKGGGYELPTVEENPKPKLDKDALRKQKEAAGRVAGSGGDKQTPSKEIKYEDIADPRKRDGMIEKMLNQANA